MPTIQIQTNTALGREEKTNLLVSSSKAISDIMKKPVCDIMVLCSQCEFIMAGSSSPAAFVDVRVVSGLSLEIAKAMCDEFARILREHAGVDPSRVYVNFFEVDHVHAWRFVEGTAVFCPKKAV